MGQDSVLRLSLHPLEVNLCLSFSNQLDDVVFHPVHTSTPPHVCCSLTRRHAPTPLTSHISVYNAHPIPPARQ